MACVERVRVRAQHDQGRGAGYVVQLGDYTTVGDSASSPLPSRIQTLQDRDGVVAVLDDINVGRPVVVLSGTTPTIDWNLGHHFTGILRVTHR